MFLIYVEIKLLFFPQIKKKKKKALNWLFEGVNKLTKFCNEKWKILGAPNITLKKKPHLWSHLCTFWEWCNQTKMAARSGQRNLNPETAGIEAGDFSHVELKAVLPKDQKLIHFPTRDSNILDQVYCNIPEA